MDTEKCQIVECDVAVDAQESGETASERSYKTNNKKVLNLCKNILVSFLKGKLAV